MIWTATARTMAGWPKFFRKRSYSFLNPSLFSTYQVPVRSAVGELVAHRDPLGRVEVVSFVDETGVILVSLLTSLIISVGADAIDNFGAASASALEDLTFTFSERKYGTFFSCAGLDSGFASSSALTFTSSGRKNEAFFSCAVLDSFDMEGTAAASTAATTSETVNG